MKKDIEKEEIKNEKEEIKKICRVIMKVNRERKRRGAPALRYILEGTERSTSSRNAPFKTMSQILLYQNRTQ